MSCTCGEQWLILVPKKWKKQVQYAWRFDADASWRRLGGQSRLRARLAWSETAAAEEEYVGGDEA